MAEVSTVLSFDGPIFKHQIGDDVYTLNLDELPEEVKAEAIKFAIKTASRNATAGKLGSEEDIKEAKDSVQTRFKNWLAGKWAARRESTGEPKHSILAQALSEVSNGQFTADDCAEMVSNMIEQAIEAQGLDTDSDDADVKKKIRATGNAVRKQLQENPQVAAKVQEIKLRKQQEAAAAAAEKAQGGDASELFAAMKR